MVLQTCLFNVKLYVTAWYQAPYAPFAPLLDLQLLKDIMEYKTLNTAVAEIALKKFLGHLWYLSEELVIFQFFDDAVLLATKCQIVEALHKTGGNEYQVK